MPRGELGRDEANMGMPSGLLLCLLSSQNGRERSVIAEGHGATEKDNQLYTCSLSPLSFQEKQAICIKSKNHIKLKQKCSDLDTTGN